MKHTCSNVSCYILSSLQFSISPIKLNGSFLSHRKFGVSFKSEVTAPRDIKAGMPEGCLLSLILYSLDINDTFQTPGVYLSLFADDNYIYVDVISVYICDRPKIGFCSQKAAARCQCYLGPLRLILH
jgi:hypothetical protein